MILLRKALAALLALALGAPASAGQNSRPATPPTGTPAVPVAGMDLRIGVPGAEAGALTPQPVQLGPGLDLPAAVGTQGPAAAARTEAASAAAVRAETGAAERDPGAAAVPAIGPLQVVASEQPAGAEPEDKPDVAAGAAAAKAVVKDLKPGDPGWVVPTRPAGAPASIAEMSLEPEAGRTYHPSPEDWSDEVIYSLVIDRFERGPGFRTQGDPADPHSRHGGNLKGLLARLDYVQPLATTMVITPLHTNAPNPSIGYYAYHGYWAIDLGTVEPFIGTLEDAKAAVAAAHAKGMRVLIDPAINHMGPVFVYKGEPGWSGMDGAPKEIGRWQYDVYPVELRDPAHYERRGPIADWNALDQRLHGDFPPDLRKLRTDRPETQDVIIHTVLWWIKELDADGLRIDSHDHIHRSFWDRFFPALRAYTARLGKTNFFVPGELFHGDPKNVAAEVGPGKLDGAYNYPEYFWGKKALHGQESTHALAWGFYQISKAFGAAAKRLIRFIDNQDKPRFLKPGEPLGVLQVALAYVFFSIGIPFVQYGTEQALRDLGTEDLGFGTEREDLWKIGFAQDGPMYRYIAELNRLRKQHPALRRGEQYIRWVDPETPEGQPFTGVYAFSRIYKDQEVVVVMNTSGEERTVDMWVDAERSPAGAVLVDALDGSYSVATRAEGPGARVSVKVPGHQARLLVRGKPAGGS